MSYSLSLAPVILKLSAMLRCSYTFVLAVVLCSSATAATDKPNIVFIFADDWGWGDLSCGGDRFL
jgi:hypothetical protein